VCVCVRERERERVSVYACAFKKQARESEAFLLYQNVGEKRSKGHLSSFMICVYVFACSWIEREKWA
jgi:hypothetical protein